MPLEGFFGMFIGPFWGRDATENLRQAPVAVAGKDEDFDIAAHPTCAGIECARGLADRVDEGLDFTGVDIAIFARNMRL